MDSASVECIIIMCENIALVSRPLTEVAFITECSRNCESSTEIVFSNVKLGRNSFAQPVSSKIENLEVK